MRVVVEVDVDVDVGRSSQCSWALFDQVPEIPSDQLIERSWARFSSRGMLSHMLEASDSSCLQSLNLASEPGNGLLLLDRCRQVCHWLSCDKER